VLRLLIATTNAGKLAEITPILAAFPLEIVSLWELAEPPQVIEDGRSFEENALKKARAFAAFARLPTLADDSGLEVDALNGAPGIYSARYAGADADDERNNRKLLSELDGLDAQKRAARFVCALALCIPEGAGEWVIRGCCEGSIAAAPRGSEGFGYDPLFFFPPMNKTFGEISGEQKAAISHRGKALTKLAALLPSILNSLTKP
jgi:XTP/dITP diphosphohydrolase